MFIWLASYPKSGNTLVRSMLAAYFFSKNGIYEFDQIKNIKQFPEVSLFENLGIDVKNEKEVIKNYIKAQELINKKNTIQFFKTHSYLFNIENNPFTNLENSLGVIYIVRDPRNVLISASHHNQKSHEETVKDMIEGYVLNKKDGTTLPVYTGNWSSNYKSWKSFKSVNKYLLVKYEDLINDKEKTFQEILKFIYKLKNIDFILDKKKFNNIIQSTDFEKVQKLEDKKGFEESVIDKNTGKKIKFFRLGAKTNWQSSLNPNLQNIIQKEFFTEMNELEYL